MRARLPDRGSEGTRTPRIGPTRRQWSPMVICRVGADRCRGCGLRLSSETGRCVSLSFLVVRRWGARHYARSVRKELPIPKTAASTGVWSYPRSRNAGFSIPHPRSTSPPRTRARTSLSFDRFEVMLVTSLHAAEATERRPVRRAWWPVPAEEPSRDTPVPPLRCAL
jgi:hypothetical protein